MRYRLPTLITQLTLRDLFWLTTIIALVVVWRTDLAQEEAVYRDTLQIRAGNTGREFRIISHVAEHHPELLTELKAFDAANNKNLSERADLNYRLNKLVNKARNLYKNDKEDDQGTDGQ